MATLKAYYASYRGEDWVTCVHGETPAKAKSMFALVDPSCDYSRDRWVDIRLSRIPDWDDRPFFGSAYYELFTPSGEDDEGNPVWDWTYVDCHCPLCKQFK